jgi:RimJ/RimL family protein N-acetyltransferase
MARVNVENLRSRRVTERLGFELLMERAPTVNPTVVDSIYQLHRPATARP